MTRIGLVCPYSLDVRGGVQAQVLGLAGSLDRLGHHVEVLAPGRPNTGQHPAWVTTTGQDLPVRWNGSVARLDLGPQTARRTRTWLGEGRFDVLHVHEPVTPSVTWHALGAPVPPVSVVATVHTAQHRALAMRAGAATVARRSRRVDAHIAVSTVAARTLARYSDAPVEVIPNALELERFAGTRTVGEDPTVLFLGRVDEPRKGLAVALRAMRAVVEAHPGARLVVAGPGTVGSEALAPHVDVRGPVEEAEKAALLRSADLVVAPHLGGESFGIVVAEAMAAGAPVVASDLPAFRTLLGQGRHGVLVPPGRAADLAAAVSALLADPARRTSLGRSGRAAARRLDWSVVTPRIVEVYDRTLSHR